MFDSMVAAEDAMKAISRPERKKRRREMAEHARQHGVVATAREYGVERTTVYRAIREQDTPAELTDKEQQMVTWLRDHAKAMLRHRELDATTEEQRVQLGFVVGIAASRNLCTPSQVPMLLDLISIADKSILGGMLSDVPELSETEELALDYRRRNGK